MDDLTRRKLIAGAGGLAAGGALLEGSAAAARARVVGAPGNGARAVEVVGTLVQDGVDLAGYGYVTHIHGIDDVLLFTGATPNEAGARFTFSAGAKVVSISNRGSVFSATGLGTVDFFFDPDGGGDFNAPATFADGTRIARFDARFQNVLTVIAPDRAVIALSGDLVQRQTRGFQLDGRRHRLGRRRLRERLSVNGLGTRTDATIPRAVFDVAGNLVLAL